MTFEELLALPQFTLRQADKERLLTPSLNSLTRHHRRNCPAYDRLLRALHPVAAEAASLAQVPFLPVGLFKSHRLQSIPESAVFKTLISSGTTGQQVSQIILDRETARRQTAALGRIMTHILGPQRLPMLIVDSAALLRDRRRFNARAAGVLGMMNFGRDHAYVLEEDMTLNRAVLEAFLQKHAGQPVLIFGFTFMVWQYFLKAIEASGYALDRAILVHSGGWKKLQEMAVSHAEFRRAFTAACGLRQIYNFYGMVEQVGSVCLEGEDGYLYPPNFADIVIRDPDTLEEAPAGRPGVIQVLSVLPESYPGHSILTEDLGVVHAIDNAACGRSGKAFSVLGRVPRAELRGCSDVHASQVPA